MIKILKLFIVLLIIPLNAFSQESNINAYDHQGLKTGVWKKYYDNGNILYEGTFSQGKPIGILKRYFEGGVLKAEMNYYPDGIQSFAKLYYESRVLAAEGKYIGQEKDSIWNYYSFINKRLTIKESYSEGLKNGPSLKFYDGGMIAEKMNWKNDTMNGKWEQYYDNGQLRLTCNHLNGIRDGEFSSFNRDGTKLIHGNYIGGNMDGIWVYYAKDNTIDFEVEYVDGQMIINEAIQDRIKEFTKMLEQSEDKYQEPDISNFK